MKDLASAKRFLQDIFQIPSDYIIPLQITIQAKEILLQLLSKINKIQCTKPNFTFVTKGIDKLKLSSFYDSIPKNIQDEIEVKSYNQEMYDFILPSGRQMYLYIMSEIKKDSSILYNHIYVWLQFIDSLTTKIKIGKECCQSLNIFIIMNENEKKLPKERFVPLHSNNINSGFTFTCKENNDIFIYRKEEVLKVFIHETFHSFHLDFSNMDQTRMNEKIKETFQGIHGNQDLRIYEAYTETWAEMINILLLNKTETSFHKINESIFYEKLWSIFQCGKILHHYNLILTDLLTKNIDSISFGNEKDTFPFSYFVLKAICLENINEFLLFCHKENSHFINFTHTIKNTISFCSLVTTIKKKDKTSNHINNITFMNGLDRVHVWFYQDIKKKINQNDVFFLKTLRMSMYG